MRRRIPPAAPSQLAACPGLPRGRATGKGAREAPENRAGKEPRVPAASQPRPGCGLSTSSNFKVGVRGAGAARCGTGRAGRRCEGVPSSPRLGGRATSGASRRAGRPGRGEGHGAVPPPALRGRGPLPPGPAPPRRAEAPSPRPCPCPAFPTAGREPVRARGAHPPPPSLSLPFRRSSRLS